jgi:hypothetical protein
LQLLLGVAFTMHPALYFSPCSLGLSPFSRTMLQGNSLTPCISLSFMVLDITLHPAF